MLYDEEADRKRFEHGEVMKERLDIWDDDESDELFYTDRYALTSISYLLYLNILSRPRWRSSRARKLAIERAEDDKNSALEARQAEHLRLESESFLARQMAEMQSLAEEQRKAGLLMDDGAPVKLSISAIPATAASGAETASKTAAAAANTAKPKPAVFGVEEEDEGIQKRKIPLVKIDFGGVEAAGRQERLDKLKSSVKKDKESLFKAKIRWDAINDVSFHVQISQEDMF